MLHFYVSEENTLKPVSFEQAEEHVKKLVWIDLFCPTDTEEHFVEKLLDTNIPTRDEMHQIELSSRLYQENGAVYATATILTRADTPVPESHAISFVLAGQCLMSVRYSDPQPFKTFLARTSAYLPLEPYHGNTALTGIIEAIVDRMADILENIGHNVDSMTHSIFRPHLQGKDSRAKEKPELEEMLRQVGISGDLLSKARESMLSISRLLAFIVQTPYFKSGSEEAARVQTLLRDIQALNDHASFLSGKLNFLLDATLGMLSIEQNGIIKIFSVAAVVFLPPTLVASIYGMNFDEIPELHLSFGYPMALFLMALSAYLPYRFFKKKGWL